MEPIQPQRAVDLATSALRLGVLRSEWPADSMLPPERTLAQTLGVSRLTLRAALSRLEAEGLIQPRQGQGIWVLDWREHSGLAMLAYLPEREAMVEVLRLRRTLAAEAVAGACIHSLPEQIQQLEQVARTQQRTENEERFFAGELHFTRLLVRACGSLPLILLFNTMEQIFRAQPALLRAQLRDRSTAVASYFALIALIKTGEAELARRAILQVLTADEQKILGSLLDQP